MFDETCDAPTRRALAEAHRVGRSKIGQAARAWVALGRCMEERRSQRPTVLLIHVSKAGGTSMCAAAVLAGCRDARWGEYYPKPPNLCSTRPTSLTARVGKVLQHLDWDNCLCRRFDDGPRWVMEPASPAFEYWFADRGSQRELRGLHTCQARALWLRARSITFHAIEGPLSDDMVAASACAEQMVRVMPFRDPIDRIQSHLVGVLQASNRSHELLSRSRIFYADQRPDLGASPASGSRDLLPGSEQAPRAEPSFNLGYLAALLPLIFDNAYCRMLAGRAVALLPFGAINASHYAVALSVLQRVDYVLPLGSPHTADVLEAGLGWPSTSSERADPRRSPEWSFATPASRREAAPFSLTDRQWLAELNHFDYALFGVAHAQHHLDVASLGLLRQYAPSSVGHTADVSPPNNATAPALGNWTCCGFSCASC